MEEVENTVKSAFVGFDGFIDRLSRVVEFRDGRTVQEYAGIAEFGAHVTRSAGISCDLELNTRHIVPGGNAPIMAQAMGRLGVDVTLAAAVGEGSPHPAFSEWARYCHMLPLGESGETLALEFDDGKVMLADLKPLAKLTWDHVKQIIGLQKLRSVASKVSLIVLTCYSLLPHGEELYEGFRQEVVSALHADQKRIFFFDLADPSKHSAQFIRRCCEVLAAYRPYGTTILGMNQNEAACLAKACGLDEDCMPKALEILRERGVADVLLMHSRDSCLVCDERGVRRHQGQLVEHPVVSTGGGDHFNAGVCAALLEGCDLDSAVKAGIRVSHDFVASGKTPSAF